MGELIGFMFCRPGNYVHFYCRASTPVMFFIFRGVCRCVDDVWRVADQSLPSQTRRQRCSTMKHTPRHG